MIIKIDTRETALLQQMLIQTSMIPIFKNIQLKTETLAIGDIIINDGKEDKLIIERKSVNDLLSSIKDGRYEEQSYRLNGLEHHNHNIIYLIEGDVNKINRFKNDTKIEKLTLYSAMFSLNYYKGFSVFRSFNMEETANMICNMAYKIEKTNDKLPFYNNSNFKTTLNVVIEPTTTNSVLPTQQDGTEAEEAENNISENKIIENDKDYVSVVKKVKKENITPDNIGEIMLCQIPGISSVTAIAIMEKYGSISKLIQEIETNNDCMKDLTYTNSKGQVRKINKTIISNIVKFLLKK